MTDVEMLLYSMYAREAVINYGERGYTKPQAEAKSKDLMISLILKEAGTLPVNFDI